MAPDSLSCKFILNTFRSFYIVIFFPNNLHNRPTHTATFKKSRVIPSHFVISPPIPKPYRMLNVSKFTASLTMVFQLISKVLGCFLSYWQTAKTHSTLLYIMVEERMLTACWITQKHPTIDKERQQCVASRAVLA